MKYCKKCGTIRVNGADFCPSCGAELPKLIDPAHYLDDGSASFYIDGKRIEVKPYNVDVFDLTFDIGQNFVRLYNDLDDYLSNWGTYFDSVFENAIPFFFKSLTSMIDYFYNWLCENDINIFSENEFYDEMLEILEIEKDMDIFVDWARTISEQIDKLNTARMAQRASRSRWQGGGFGIKGAVKGAISAGMLNLGTDILRSIGDSYIDKKDAEKIRQLKRETGQIVNPDLFLKRFFAKYYMHALKYSLQCYILYYEDRDLADSFDRTSFALDASEAMRSDMLFDPKAIENYRILQCEAISIYPFDPRPYVNLIESAGSEQQQIELLVEDADIIPFFEAMVILNVQEYLFQLQTNFSGLSNAQKIDYVQRLGRLSYCSCLHDDAKNIRQIYYKYVDKLKGMGLLK